MTSPPDLVSDLLALKFLHGLCSPEIPRVLQRRTLSLDLRTYHSCRSFLP